MELIAKSLSVIAAAGLAALWVYVWLRRPPAPFWPNLQRIIIAGVLYVFGDLLTRDPHSLLVESLGITLLYAGIQAAAWAWLSLASGLQGGASERWSRPLLRVFGLCSVGVVALVATNPWHGLILEPVLGGRNEYRTLWWLHAGLAALQMSGAIALLLLTAARTQDGHHRRSALLLAAIGASLAAGSFTYALAPVDLGLDPVVPLILACNLALVLGIYQLHIFNLLPETLPEIVDRTLDAIVLGDESGRIVYANRAAHSLLGPDLATSKHPVLFDLLSQQLEDETGELSAELLREALARTVNAERTITARTKHQPHRVVTVRIHELTWGRTSFAMAAELQDITERHEQRRQLKVGERRLRRLIHTVPVGILSCNLDGTIETVNPRLLEILGAPNTGAVLGLGILSEQVQRNDEIRGIFERSLYGGESTYSQEIHHTTNWGREIVARISAEPMRDSEDRIVGALAMVEDVTRSKQLAEEQRQLERRMFDAQRLQSLGMVSGAIAHDFNNLLTIIKGHVEFGLRKLEPGSDVRQHLQQIAQSTEHGSELADQIMAYAGQAPSSMHPMDCSSVAAEMETLLEAVIGKRVAFELDLALDLPQVLGDRGQIRQVLVNLLLNASHAQEGRKGSVTLRTATAEFNARTVRDLVVGYELPVGRYVLLEVSDQGCGMSHSTRERVFDPFFTTREDGRGLGLAATLGIVRAHGAALALTSQLEQGTTFRIFFPALQASAEQAEEEKEGAAQGSTAP